MANNNFSLPLLILLSSILDYVIFEAFMKKLNTNIFKEFVMLGDLKENQKYTVNNFCIRKSQYGPQLHVDVDNKYHLNNQIDF